MIHIVTWFWGYRYPVYYVDKLFRGVKRNLTREYVFHCCVEPDRKNKFVERFSRPKIEGRALTWLREDHPTVGHQCFARLVVFDPEWQTRQGIAQGDYIVNMDIDLIVTRDLDPLIDLQGGEFRIMSDFNTTNACPFNGSFWMFRAGEREDVWKDFSIANYHRFGIPFHAAPDDQGWLHHKFPDARTYTPQDGVYAFKKKHWPEGVKLPANARVVAFPGKRDPHNWKVTAPWIATHWI